MATALSIASSAAGCIRALWRRELSASPLVPIASLLYPERFRRTSARRPRVRPGVARSWYHRSSRAGRERRLRAHYEFVVEIRNSARGDLDLICPLWTSGGVAGMRTGVRFGMSGSLVSAYQAHRDEELNGGIKYEPCCVRAAKAA